MRFWISRGIGTPIYEQLNSQLLLGIVSGTLGPGDRLPSVRALSRRLDIHWNTISAVYRDLAAEGWVEARRGSGVFVTVKGGAAIDIPGFALVIDTDPALAEIIAAELTETTGAPFESCGCTEEARALATEHAVWANAARAGKVSEFLGDVPLRPVAMRSVESMLAGRKRPDGPVLVSIASRSPSVRQWAGRLLAALGYGFDSVLIRDPGEPGWQEGLGTCDVLAADVVAAKEVPAGLGPIVFRIVAERKVSQDRASVSTIQPKV